MDELLKGRKLTITRLLSIKSKEELKKILESKIEEFIPPLVHRTDSLLFSNLKMLMHVDDSEFINLLLNMVHDGYVKNGFSITSNDPNSFSYIYLEELIKFSSITALSSAKELKTKVHSLLFDKLFDYVRKLKLYEPSQMSSPVSSQSIPSQSTSQPNSPIRMVEEEEDDGTNTSEEGDTLNDLKYEFFKTCQAYTNSEEEEWKCYMSLLPVTKKKGRLTEVLEYLLKMKSMAINKKKIDIEIKLNYDIFSIYETLSQKVDEKYHNSIVSLILEIVKKKLLSSKDQFSLLQKYSLIYKDHKEIQNLIPETQASRNYFSAAVESLKSISKTHNFPRLRKLLFSIIPNSCNFNFNYSYFGSFNNNLNSNNNINNNNINSVLETIKKEFSFSKFEKQEILNSFKESETLFHQSINKNRMNIDAFQNLRILISFRISFFLYFFYFPDSDSDSSKNKNENKNENENNILFFYYSLIQLNNGILEQFKILEIDKKIEIYEDILSSIYSLFHISEKLKEKKLEFEFGKNWDIKNKNKNESFGKIENEEIEESENKNNYCLEFVFSESKKIELMFLRTSVESKLALLKSEKSQSEKYNFVNSKFTELSETYLKTHKKKIAVLEKQVYLLTQENEALKCHALWFGRNKKQSKIVIFKPSSMKDHIFFNCSGVRWELRILYQSNQSKSNNSSGGEKNKVVGDIWLFHDIKNRSISLANSSKIEQYECLNINSDSSVKSLNSKYIKGKLINSVGLSANITEEDGWKIFENFNCSSHDGVFCFEFHITINHDVGRV